MNINKIPINLQIECKEIRKQKKDSHDVIHHWWNILGKTFAKILVCRQSMKGNYTIERVFIEIVPLFSGDSFVVIEICVLILRPIIR